MPRKVYQLYRFISEDNTDFQYITGTEEVKKHVKVWNRKEISTS